jgi:hypothetical protein
MRDRARGVVRRRPLIEEVHGWQARLTSPSATGPASAGPEDSSKSMKTSTWTGPSPRTPSPCSVARQRAARRAPLAGPNVVSASQPPRRTARPPPRAQAAAAALKPDAGGRCPSRLTRSRRDEPAGRTGMTIRALHPAGHPVGVQPQPAPGRPGSPP